MLNNSVIITRAAAQNAEATNKAVLLSATLLRKIKYNDTNATTGSSRFDRDTERMIF